MRFMLLILARRKGETGALPEPEVDRRNDEIQRRAHQSGRAVRARRAAPFIERRWRPVSGGTAVVSDGPFTEAKELLGGYWLIQVNGKEEGDQVTLMKPCPASKTSR